MKANYEIIEDTPECLCIKDVGPWDVHQTITNGAEEVVRELAPILNGRRLEYIDSSGYRDQLLVRNGVFFDFAPAEPTVRDNI